MEQLEGKVATLTAINGALQKEIDSLRKVRALCSIRTSLTRFALPSAAFICCPVPASAGAQLLPSQDAGLRRASLLHVSCTLPWLSESAVCWQPSSRAAQKRHDGTCSAQEASNGAGDTVELAELQKEFQRQLGTADRTIVQLKVRQ